MKNPNVSEEAKEHSRQVIDDFDSDSHSYQQRQEHEKDETRVNAGYKATLKSEFRDVSVVALG